MSSFPPRDPETDHLLTPRNAAFLIIDYQPTQIHSIGSMQHPELVRNIVTATRLAVAYRLPIVLSTVNVATGRNKPTIEALTSLLGDTPSYDRTTINAWEDSEFQTAVKATGRKKLIICALWTEACLTFPALDALREGFEVYAPVDAVAGTSVAAHEAGLRRIEQAGAQLTSIPQLGCELQRDWNRRQTIEQMFSIFSDAGIFMEL